MARRVKLDKNAVKPGFSCESGSPRAGRRAGGLLRLAVRQALVRWTESRPLDGAVLPSTLEVAESYGSRRSGLNDHGCGIRIADAPSLIPHTLRRQWQAKLWDWPPIRPYPINAIRLSLLARSIAERCDERKQP